MQMSSAATNDANLPTHAADAATNGPKRAALAANAGPYALSVAPNEYSDTARGKIIDLAAGVA
jgi:hypothetical protein